MHLFGTRGLCRGTFVRSLQDVRHLDGCIGPELAIRTRGLRIRDRLPHAVLNLEDILDLITFVIRRECSGAPLCESIPALVRITIERVCFPEALIVALMHDFASYIEMEGVNIRICGRIDRPLIPVRSLTSNLALHKSIQIPILVEE